ncbi:MAG: hypothetical protein EBZ49_00435 [Proteobacteria bacterium]|nr:hypothetical protein [Pseudomonadota bacterium]
MEKYRIINTTVKPVRLDANGKDTRKTIERVGHGVQWRDEQDRVINLQANKQYFVNRIDGGLLGLARAGLIKIEKVDDVTDVLSEHVYQPKTVVAQATAKKATAVQMGLDDHAEASGKEYEGAVNPDGDPNFLVTAHRDKSKRVRRQRNADTTGTEISGKAEQSEEVSATLS